MNDLLAPLRSYLSARSARERWLLVAGACALALVIVYTSIVAPLGEDAREADARVRRARSSRRRSSDRAPDRSGHRRASGS